ncbi:A/G-specific adenine glycosylase [Candidatus Sumerlaeota bacterium]|nr:A/G-specific adenine glycosylase [Candidatus Sumerlaeota bacterium]
MQLEWSNGELSNFRRRLLRWFRAERRDLPWRGSRDPYGVLVSEVMLQQTQVETVRERWIAFMERLPDLRALAEADEREVTELWAGLGYYSRARRLRELARICMERHGGELPRGAEALGALPGMGRYTAGAVGSIAFGLPLSVVDGNVARVFSRLFLLRRNFAESAAKQEYWALADALLARRAPGDWNEALMELGATVCRPASPDCAQCPVRDFCHARREGRQDKFPPPKKRKATVEIQEICLVTVCDGRALLRRNAPDDWCAGQWDFPRFNVAKTDASAIKLAKSLGLRGRPKELGAVKHTVTHHRIVRTIYALKVKSTPTTLAENATYTWHETDDLEQQLHNTLARKTWRLFQERTSLERNSAF